MDTSHTYTTATLDIQTHIYTCSAFIEAVPIVLDSGTRKAGWNPRELQQLTERNMDAVTPRESTLHYTDGSVDPSKMKTGAALSVEGGDTGL